MICIVEGNSLEFTVQGDSQTGVVSIDALFPRSTFTHSRTYVSKTVLVGLDCVRPSYW